MLLDFSEEIYEELKEDFGELIEEHAYIAIGASSLVALVIIGSVHIHFVTNAL